jgi:plastocyanin
MNVRRFAAVCGFVVLLTAPAAALANADAPASVAAPGVRLAQAGGVAITISDPYTYSPLSVRVTPGTTVTWTNTSTESHTATSRIPGIFDSGILSPGQLYSVTLTEWSEGIPYRCEIHPNMVGFIQVMGPPLQAPA